jgi:hypothetical protein
MAGKNQSATFVLGHPSDIKPTRHGLCSVCAKDCYRETFTPGEGWAWRHHGCDPNQARVERHRTRAGAAMAYVPKSYAVQKEAGREMDPALVHALSTARGWT